MMPEVVLRAGGPWASKVLASWLSRTAAAGAVHVAVDPDWTWKDAGREVAVRAPGVFEVAGADGAAPVEQSAWSRAWAEAETAAQGAVDDVLSRHPEITEPGVARALYGLVPANGAIVASSSMPVRDLEWFGRPRPGPPQVFSNRGANGIDGVVSTALGVAAAGVPGGVFALVGDLAVLHDASALVRPAVGGPVMPLVVVVLDNDGGGIFNFLPQADELVEAEFERLFGTPQRPAVSDLARGCGYSVLEPAVAADVVGALQAAGEQAAATGLPVFVVVRTDRRSNVALHGEIDAAVREALNGLRAGTP
jgi:2-succinyl-5-enolpyruvyl-6-hydroxy-3-cyclohexene-1-carboxylate synthase